MSHSPEKQTNTVPKIETISANPNIINDPVITERFRGLPSFNFLSTTGNEQEPFFGGIAVATDKDTNGENAKSTSFAVNQEGQMSYTIDSNPRGIGLIYVDQGGKISQLTGDDASGIGVLESMSVQDEIVVMQKGTIDTLKNNQLLSKSNIDQLTTDESHVTDLVRVKFDTEPEELNAPVDVSQSKRERQSAAKQAVARRLARKSERAKRETANNKPSQDQLDEEQAAIDEKRGFRVIDNRRSQDLPATTTDEEGKLYPLEGNWLDINGAVSEKTVSVVVDPSFNERALKSKKTSNETTSIEAVEVAVTPEILEARQKLAELREDMAKLAAKRQGRLFSGNKNKASALEEEYTEQLQELGRLECADLLNDPTKTREEKNIGAIAFIFDEQRKLREDTAENLKSTKVSGLIAWIGAGSKKQQFAKGALVGAGAVVVGAGIGAIAGVAAGAGLAAAAAITAKSTLNFGRYYAKKDSQLGRGMDTTVSGEETVFKQMEINNINGSKSADIFDLASDYAMSKFNQDTELEQEKRRKSARSAVGGVALGLVLGGTLAYAAGEMIQGTRVGDWVNKTIDTPVDATDGPDGQMSPSEKPDFSSPDAGPSDTGELPSTEPAPAPAATPETDYGYSDSATTVTAGEGWYQTFNEMGITNANQQYELLHNEALMQQLADQGLAYRDVSLGGWGMNMTPNGEMPVKALETIRQYTR